MQDALFWIATIGGAGLGLLTAVYLAREGLKTKPEGPSGYFWFAAWPVICGVVIGFITFFMVFVVVAFANVVMSQHVALGIGATAGLAVALRENHKHSEKGMVAIKNVAGLVVACAFLASMGWIVVQGAIQCGGSCVADREDLYRGR